MRAKVAYGFGMHQRGDRALVGRRRIEDDRRRPGRRELTAVVRVRQEGERAGAGLGQRGDMIDVRLGIAAQLAAESNGQFGEPHRRTLDRLFRASRAPGPCCATAARPAPAR